MGGLDDGSNSNRVITARHVADRALPSTNNAINSTALCHSYTVEPDFGTYLTVLNPYAWVLWSCGLLFVIATCVLYAVTLRSALRHWKHCAVNVSVVLAVYPLVAAAGFLAVVIPRARLLTEAVAQEAVMIAMYHFFRMVITECGGPDQLVRQAAGARLDTRVLPCCCWPCCFLPRPRLQKNNLRWLRYLVLQMPVIQTILYIIILVLWAEDMDLYLHCFIYIQPFIAASILSGLWGIIMSLRVSENAGYSPRFRFLALQLVLLIVKLQCGFAKILPELIDFPCILPLNPSVFANMIQNSLVILEMLILSIWAWRLYRVPPGKRLDKAVHVSVAVLDDSVKTLAFKDKLENSPISP